MVKRSLNVCLFTIVLAGCALWSYRTDAYSRYASPPPEEATFGCVQCHDGFANRGLLHDLHEGNAQMTKECLLCHVSTGDDPSTYSSGASGGQGCRGCHGVNNGTSFGWGAGLRAHHKNANAPADSDGLRCADCHTNDLAPSAESVLPVYYSRTDVFVKNPCLAAPARPGEDFDGDGKGLDNNGNLLYDENDDSCAFKITSVIREGNDIRVSWQSVVGVTNFLQTALGGTGGNFSNNFTDAGSLIVTTGSVVVITNRVDSGGATNLPARYYRVRGVR